MTKDEQLEIFTLIQNAVKPMLETVLDEKLIPLQESFARLETRQTSLEKSFTRLEARQTSLEESFTRLEARQTSIEESFTRLEEKFTSLETRQTSIEIKIETEINRAIHIISEGHLDLSRNFTHALMLEPRVEILEGKISAIEYELQQAK